MIKCSRLVLQSLSIGTDTGGATVAVAVIPSSGRVANHRPLDLNEATACANKDEMGEGRGEGVRRLRRAKNKRNEEQHIE